MIECHLLKKITVINKIVPDLMDTLYSYCMLYNYNLDYFFMATLIFPTDALFVYT